MHRNIPKLLFAGLILVLSAIPASGAEQPAGAEAKLREALRATMVQLRDVQAQLAAVQAEKAELDDKFKELDAKLKRQSKEADDERLKSAKAITDLNNAGIVKDGEIEKLTAQLEKARQEIEQKNKLQAATEDRRKTFEEKSIMLDRRVADQQARNAAMYRIGLEILNRYEKFGLGDAISAREPFIGTTRVKFQNLVQDYQDKLTEQKIKAGGDARHGTAEDLAARKDQKSKSEESASKKRAKPDEVPRRPRD